MPWPSGTRHSPRRASSSERAPLTRRPARTTSPAVRRMQPGDHLQRRRLARAVRAEQREHRARRAPTGRHRAAPRCVRRRRARRRARGSPRSAPARWSRHSRRTCQSGRSRHALAEVGGDHRLVALDLRRRADREDFAEVEHAHLVRHAAAPAARRARRARPRSRRPRARAAVRRTPPSRTRPARTRARRAAAPADAWPAHARPPPAAPARSAADRRVPGPRRRRPTRSMISSATLAGSMERSRRCRRSMSAATRMLLRTSSSVNSSSRWNVRASPARARLYGSSRVTSRPSMRTRPAVGTLQPADHVEQRRLAGAVRTDQPGDSPG